MVFKEETTKRDSQLSSRSISISTLIVMYSSVLVLGVLACISVANCGFDEDNIANTQKCGAAHNIPKDVLAKLYTYSYISALDPSEDVKCFSKCVGDVSDYFNTDGSISWEFYRKFSAPAKKSDLCLKSIYDYCTSINPFASDCDKAWSLFVCLQNYKCYEE